MPRAAQAPHSRRQRRSVCLSPWGEPSRQCRLHRICQPVRCPSCVPDSFPSPSPAHVSTLYWGPPRGDCLEVIEDLLVAEGYPPLRSPRIHLGAHHLLGYPSCRRWSDFQRPTTYDLLLVEMAREYTGQDHGRHHWSLAIRLALSSHVSGSNHHAYLRQALWRANSLAR